MGDIFGGMAVSVEMHHTVCVPAVRSEIVAIIEHARADQPGDWHVSIFGSQANDRWECDGSGPESAALLAARADLVGGLPPALPQ